MTGSGRNGFAAAAVCAAIAAMTGLSFAAIPLYRLFCAATGYAGTPNVGPAPSPGASGQIIRVRFNADINPALPWTFAADQAEVVSNLGEEQVAFYHAVNHSGRSVTGMALYNVTPEKIGRYFHKTACFCFNKQTLSANQSMEFPISFWVDPAIRTDPNTADIKVITLSYTFYESLDVAEKLGALAHAGPHIGPISAVEPAANSKTN